MLVTDLAGDVVTATKDTAVEELSRLMQDEGLGNVIISEQGEPVGIVTERDIALTVGKTIDVAVLTAEDIMSWDPITVHEDVSVMDLCVTMADGQLRRVPVTDDDGTIVGIVTADDVVATLGDMLGDAASVIEW